MNVIVNQKLVDNRRRIGQITTLASLVVLGGGFFLSFTPEWITYSFVALIGGFILSQVGIYYGSRWGRSPRVDEQVTLSLKGLEGKYSLYHYKTGVPHLLVGPAGIWVLLPYYQGGTITYDEKKRRWMQKGGNWYLKLFAQEGLGRPDLEIEPYLADINHYLDKIVPADLRAKLPAPKIALVFTSPKADVQAAEAPVPTMHTEKLKDFIRRMAKQEPLSMEIVKGLQQLLPLEEKNSKEVTEKA